MFIDSAMIWYCFSLVLIWFGMGFHWIWFDVVWNFIDVGLIWHGFSLPLIWLDMLSLILILVDLDWMCSGFHIVWFDVVWIFNTFCFLFGSMFIAFDLVGIESSLILICFGMVWIDSLSEAFRPFSLFHVLHLHNVFRRTKWWVSWKIEKGNSWKCWSFGSSSDRCRIIWSISFIFCFSYVQFLERNEGWQFDLDAL